MSPLAYETLAYEIVDVFTGRPFAGNPLAVVLGASGLTGTQLQALAREFNLSETVFLLPATQPGASYRVRIFTPTRELPFAGHPSIGAAVVASRHGLAPTPAAVQECGAGLLPIEITADRAALTGGTPTLGEPLDPGPLLAAAGLTGDDLAGPVPRRAGCGLEFHYLAVRPDAVVRAAVESAAAAGAGVEQLCVFAWAGATGTAGATGAAGVAGAPEAHSRVFAPGAGVPEDPATGSAALGLGVFAVASGLLPGEGRSSYRVRQGAEVGRPSLLECTVTAAGQVAVEATVAGQVVPIARGEIAVPPAD